jgi:hypothetical protein
MQDPLKQGLKLFSVAVDKITIRMQDPLKQGLKHSFIAISVALSSDSNARSTKTRIAKLKQGLKLQLTQLQAG